MVKMRLRRAECVKVVGVSGKRKMNTALQHEHNFMGLEATGIQTQRQTDTGPGSQGDGYLVHFCRMLVLDSKKQNLKLIECWSSWYL